MPGKALVVDANILVRAVLGKRVRQLIERYAGQVLFFVPVVAYAEAEEHLPALVMKHSGDPGAALAFLRSLVHLVELVEIDVYRDFETEARARLGQRDPEDWPILACALAFDCPIWTEDAAIARHECHSRLRGGGARRSASAITPPSRLQFAGTMAV